MRYVYVILFAVVLGFPFALRRAMVREDRAAEQTRGAARLVIVTPHNGDIRGEFARAFDAWHRRKYGQPVVIDFRVPGGTSDLVRFLAGIYATFRGPDGKLPPIVPVDLDLVWGGGDYTFYHDLQPLGILEPIQIDPKLLRGAFPQDALAGVRLYDQTRDFNGNSTPQWVGICLSSFGIIYNPQLYSTLGLAPPKQWGDLADPKLFGLIALADPAHSGSAAVTYMMVIQRAMADAESEFFVTRPEAKKLPRAELRKMSDYRDAIAAGWKRGMGQLLLIAANARYFTDSSELPPTDVARGDAAAGMSIDFYARVTEGSAGPERARFVAPHAATAITPDPIAILHGVNGDRLILATHLVEFLLTPEAQRLWILDPGRPGGPVERSPRRMPIRRDVYADQTGWADHFNPFEEAGDFNQRGEWMATLSETRPVWDAAWIDSRDALVESYQSILRVNDSSRRARLLKKLADVPITLGEVEQIRVDRQKLEGEHADLDEWRARQRIEWGDRFRRHYAQVAEQAR
jgi:ABC-type Fe3+ transport system substrate-binding protein